jgi:hypothetical protein
LAQPKLSPQAPRRRGRRRLAPRATTCASTAGRGRGFHRTSDGAGCPAGAARCRLAGVASVAAPPAPSGAAGAGLRGRRRRGAAGACTSHFEERQRRRVVADEVGVLRVSKRRGAPSGQRQRPAGRSEPHVSEHRCVRHAAGWPAACARENLKSTGLAQNLGEPGGSCRDFQSNCRVNSRILGQPCEFYLEA